MHTHKSIVIFVFYRLRQLGMLLKLVLILFSLVCCNTQQVVDSSKDCNGSKNCSKVASCIEYYQELELYVTNNRVIIEGLKDAFFFTGEVPSKYVKLIYNFQVFDNNSATLTDREKCYNQTKIYIWSDSALYLFGQALVLSTLFAMDISGFRITVDLPCLCYDQYNELLSRLTYMV